MEIVVSLNVQDYLYLFYQKSAEAMQKRPEELMEQALFLYAGMVAEDVIGKKEKPEGQSLQT